MYEKYKKYKYIIIFLTKKFIRFFLKSVNYMVQFVLFFRIFCFVFQDCFKGGVSIFMRIFMKYEIH